MATPTRDQVRKLCRQFKDWVHQNVEQGIDGNGQGANYISYSKLKEYWTHNRIATILGPYDMDVDISAIQSRFIQVISILTYITDDSHRCTEYLERFYKSDTDDHSLPLHIPNPDANSTHAAMLRRVPAPFYADSDHQSWLHFSDYQWKFLPLHFKPNELIIDRVHSPRALNPCHIIPVTIEKELSRRSGRGARVLKVKPHDASGLPPEHIVLKEYDRTRCFPEFMQERHTYTTIRNIRTTGIDVSKYFLRYHGCFVQGDKCILLIEYANQGSLLEFFDRNWYLPRTKEEAQNLWSDLGHLIRGLALLHNGGKYNSAIHQDIKPANIFVSKTGSNGNRFSIKFGDFGTCSVTPIDENGDTTGHDNGGTKMYSAPELCHIDSEVHMAERVSWQADIWSFGCVLLDCGVWMTMHERGRIEFRNERIEEIRHLKQNSLIKAGYAGAFHDGEQVLSTIRNKTEEILRLDSPVAQLVGCMMEFIQKEVLRTDIMERLTAQQLQARFQDAINSPPTINSPLSSPSFSMYQTPISPLQTQTSLTCDIIVPRVGPSSQKSATWVPEPGAASDRFATRESLEPGSFTRSSTVPYQEVSQPSASTSNQHGISGLRQQSLNGFDSNTVNASTPAIAPNQDETSRKTIKYVREWIPKHKANQAFMLGWLEQPLQQLRGRDQLFVFDNSESMDLHWDDVKHAANALTYILKGVDPDGFEIHMTKSGKPLKRKDRKGLFGKLEYFDHHRPRPKSGSCPMETVLSDILEGAIDKALAPTSKFDRMRSREIRGVSVYVFTNGVWESRRNRDGSDQEAGGVENAIKTAVDRLQGAKKMRKFLSIQFISFGDDYVGMRRMRWLDDDIKFKTGGWDIVDTTHHTGDVDKMIIGAICGGVDDPEAAPIILPGT